MPRATLLLLLLPLLGLLELGLHEYFARRAPGFGDYAALAPELLKLKQPGVPVVVAPAWAEPLVRQAAPAAFPIAELTRPDDSAFARFIEVSLLGAKAPQLQQLRVVSERRVGPFGLRVLENPQAEPVVFDFVTAVDVGEVEVFSELDGALTACTLSPKPRAATGGLHGHVAYPKQRHECPGGRIVGVTLIDDAEYRPRRCILVQAPTSGSILLRFSSVPSSRRLLGYRGLSYFLSRDDHEASAELVLREPGRERSRLAVVGQAGWARFELARQESAGPVEVEVRAAKPGVDACFALEAR